MSHPERLGKYPITGVLGTGAMGVVYKAFDPVINRPVAIKTILKSLIGQDMSGSSAAERFKHEARAVGRLSHPGIVAIYEYGEDDDAAFIAMEFVEGRTLAQILAATPRLPEADILTLMDQLLAALACAHRAGVWHRDIKPANLIVTDGGQLKVTDFGIARIDSVALTQVSSSIGTPGYMAPEQYVGEGVDHRVDIFAAGVLLYTLLVGHGPFRGPAETVMYKVLNENPLAPSQVDGVGRDGFYDAIVARALAKQAAERYASVTELREALAQRGPDANAIDPEATRIVVRPGRPQAQPGPVAAEAGSGSGTRSATSPIAGWDDATLHQVELALASFIGPVAKVLVRQAARSCADLKTLTVKVGSHLANDHDRQSFMTRIGPASAAGRGGATRLTTPPKSGSAPPPASDAGGALPATLVAAATAVLARHLGPIASVVARKAAAKTRSREPFFEQLAEPVDPAERERLLAELRRLA